MESMLQDGESKVESVRKLAEASRANTTKKKKERKKNQLGAPDDVHDCRFQRCASKGVAES